MQQTTRHDTSDPRLRRLLCSGLRPNEDLERYASELMAWADELVDDDLVDAKSRLLKALANKTRLKLLLLLSRQEMCVCELTTALNLTQPTGSHHLNILENVRLVKERKEGKWVFYRIADPHVIKHLFDFLTFPTS